MDSDNSSGNTRVSMEKFDGKKNFSLWQMRMKDFLVQQNVEDALNGKEDRPEGMTERTWERINSRAVSTIRLNLADDIVYDVMEETQASVLWSKLEDLYLGKNFTNRLMLKQELYSLKRQEGADLPSHIGEFNKLLCDLSNVGVKLEDEDKAIILLTSVKSTHKHLFNTLLYGRDTITLEQVKKALISSEKLEIAEEKKSDEQALIARGKKKSNRRRYQGGGKGARDTRPYDERDCYCCGEKGHMCRDCPNRKDQNVAATMEGDNESIDDEALSIMEKSKKTSEWLLDSACSSHLCSDKGSFSSYQSMKGKVFMGNGSVGEVKGVGTVKIKTTNGLTRTLKDVRHVPSLRKNVISLGAVVSKGCSFAANDGLIKVRRGSRVMLMGRKVGNLYVLMGSTQIVGKATKSAKVWKPVKKSIGGMDDAVLATSSAATGGSTSIGDVIPSSNEAEYKSFRLGEGEAFRGVKVMGEAFRVGEGFDGLKFRGGAKNLGACGSN